MVDKPGLSATLNGGHALASGLALAYLFNEGSGTTVTDYSGNGHHGTADLTALSWVTSLYFTGANNYAMASASTAGTTRLTVSGFAGGGDDAPFTVAAWLRNAGSDSYGNIFADGFSRGLFSHNSGGGYNLDWFHGADHHNSTVLSHNTNYRIVLAASATTLKWYVNAAADGTNTFGSTDVQITNMFNDALSETFICTFDLLYYWVGRELNSTEIGTLDTDPFGMFGSASDGPDSKLYFF